jgi:hypothetical protein
MTTSEMLVDINTLIAEKRHTLNGRLRQIKEDAQLLSEYTHTHIMVGINALHRECKKLTSELVTLRIQKEDILKEMPDSRADERIEL